MMSRRATAGPGRPVGCGPLSLAGLLVAAAATLAAPAAADQGVAMSAREITFTEPLERGSRHEVPTIWVSNPGSDPADFAVQVREVAHAPRQALPVDDDRRTAGSAVPAATAPPEEPAQSVPADWLTISPDEFHLAPGGTQPITIALDVPSDAEPGRYRGLVSAGLRGRGVGSTVGAAAAVKIGYTVTAGGEVSAEPAARPGRGGAGVFDDEVALVLAAVLVLGALIASLRVKRRFVIRVERR